MAKIVTFTLNPTIDKSCKLDKLMPEINLRCHDLVIEPGGGGINVSMAIKQLGGMSTALYTTGGLNGNILSSFIEKKEIDIHEIPIQDNTREGFIVYEKSSGLQYRFGLPGPKIQKDELNLAIDIIQKIMGKGDILVVSGSLPSDAPFDFYSRLAKLAKRTGVLLILDTSGEALVRGLGDGVFLIKPNLDEIAELAGRKVTLDHEHEAVAKMLIAEGKTRFVVVSLGAAGAKLISEQSVTQYIAPTVPIQSKVGAGDSMVAGIALSLSRGDDLLEAVRMGVAAGSAAVMTPGTELCRRSDVDIIIDKVTVVKRHN